MQISHRWFELNMILRHLAHQSWSFSRNVWIREWNRRRTFLRRNQNRPFCGEVLERRLVLAAELQAVLPDTGFSASDLITAVSPNSFSGVAAPGTSIEVSRLDGADLIAIGSGVATVAGDWSATATESLSEDVYAIYLTQRDADNNVISNSGPYILVIDSTAPAVPSISSLVRLDSEFQKYDFCLKGTAEPGSAIAIMQAGGKRTANRRVGFSGPGVFAC